MRLNQTAIMVGLALCFASPVFASESTESLREAAGLEHGEEQALHLTGALRYAGLAVYDEDPSNDQYLYWSLKGSWTLPHDLELFAQSGLVQRFVAQPEESGFRLTDLGLGATWRHRFEFMKSSMLEDMPLSMRHSLTFFFPISRRSQNATLLVAPRWNMSLRWKLMEGLRIGPDVMAQYNFHRYAEQSGLHGGMNTQFLFETGLSAQYTLPLPAWFYGSMAVSGRLTTGYGKGYASSETFTADSSDREFWSQTWGWEAAMSYTPISSLSIVLGLEQGSDYLRNGIQAIEFFHRDETEVSLTLVGSY